MVKFLTTRGTALEIENIINNAQKSVVIISPFIKIPDSLFQNLKAADKKGVSTDLIYGKSTLLQDVQEQLKQLDNVKVYFLDNLHAKCYFNEQSMVITSLNLYDFSEQNNREMGVLITKQGENEAFAEAVREANRIMNLAIPQDLRHGKSELSFAKTTDRVKTTTKETQESRGRVLLRGFADMLLDTVGMKKGFCIGCKTRVDYDEYRPYCPACYQQWAKHKSQKASYCHNCGRQTTTSLNKPLCLSCFRST